MSLSKPYLFAKALLALFCILSFESTSFGQVAAPSDGGNPLLHAIGFQTFDNAATGPGVSDSTPDSNSTFDATPAGSNNAGQYLTATIGASASILGRAGLGASMDSSFLNGMTFGDGPGQGGMNIVDVTLADGSAGVRIGPNSQPGASSWSFQANGNQEFGDFSITNESDFAFRLETIHFDARSANANGANQLDLIYLAGGASNLIRATTGTEVLDLHVITELTFPSNEVLPAVHNVSAGLAGSFTTPTAVRLFPGDTASFRFRFSGAVTDFAQSQIDNLAISGTFLDQDNGFALIDPVAVPATAVLLGDVNLDGFVTFLDINPFIVVLSSNAFQAEADIDQNGAVNFLDINPFIQILAGN